VVSDAATRWVAPYYGWEPPDQYGWIFIINLGPKTAHVNVDYFWQHGNLTVRETREIDPSTRASFSAGEFVRGWVLVDSDQPVFPSGVLRWGDDPGGVRMPMTFYRAEGTEVQEWVTLPAQLLTPEQRKKVRPQR
jgi:hypothetical protein